MKFTKMNGLGNDYIYINCLEENVSNPTELARKLSNRHFGIGGDGIILIENSDIADFKMRMFNNDGSEAEMCGNGIRCVGKYVYDNGLTNKQDITIETLAGIKELNLFFDETKSEKNKHNLHMEIGTLPENTRKKVTKVQVNMGEPIFKSKDLPSIEGEEIAKDIYIEVDGEKYRFTAVSMGNPHAVTFVEDVDNIPFNVIGSKVENSPLFPHKTNVEFVEIRDKEHIKLRVWERGTGETLACGTGACASVVAAGVNGYVNHKVNVELLGGNLQIDWKDDNHVYMTGPAETVFTGEIV